jgi:pyruvate formate lyase activating enzyme
MNKARYWERKDEDTVRCGLCPHRCLIREGETGKCGVRRMKEGELFAEGYGLISSANMDPIEKKPLYHFHPGSQIFSIGGWGCNFSCVFCQNWQISQQFAGEDRAVSPEKIISQAKLREAIGIAYTYNEPLTGIEFVFDCAKLARREGLYNVLVSNGYVCEVPAGELLPFIDAANIDIKSMDEEFYVRHCGGRLGPVLDFCRQAVRSGCHVEITNLIIPGLNDSESGLAALAEWVSLNLGELTPLHLSGYHPQYKMNLRSTSVAQLEKAHSICSKYLRYVYIGNVMSRTGQNTYCPACGTLLVERCMYDVRIDGVRAGACQKCGRKTDISGLSQ